jgi:hypothetical protein
LVIASGTRPPKEKAISLSLPATIEKKFEQAVDHLGYRFAPKIIKRLRKPDLSFHQICGANRFIYLLYWDEAQTRAPYQPNSILSLCVRICRDTMDEWNERPYVIFLTHDDCPRAWVEEARDCETVGVMPFMHRSLGPIEEWDEEGLDKIIPFANELIREAKLVREGGPGTTVDASAAVGGPAAAARVVSAPALVNVGPKVFISYAHDDRDKEWYKALVEYLKQLRMNYGNEFWSDVDIEPGSNWFETIRDALTSAPIVIFVVSPALLGSEFVHRSELKPALKDNSKRILWIHGQRSPYRDSPFASIQAAHDPEVDLADAGSRRGEQLDKIYTVIKSQLQKAGVLVNAESPGGISPPGAPRTVHDSIIGASDVYRR